MTDGFDDWFDLDGDGELNAVERAYEYSVLFPDLFGKEADEDGNGNSWDDDPEEDDESILGREDDYDPDPLFGDPDDDAREEIDLEDDPEEIREEFDSCKAKLAALSERLSDLKSELGEISEDIDALLLLEPYDTEIGSVSDELDSMLFDLEMMIDRLVDLSV